MHAAMDITTLATLVDRMADAVVVAAPDGTITYWNAAAERILGWSSSDAVGRSLDLIIPDKQRRPHWEGYERVMATGETRYGASLLRVPAQHADGTRRSIAFTVTLLVDDSGEINGIAAVIRDETDRWGEEQELRRRLRGYEAEAG